MVAPRANWKGYIKFGEVAFPVALYTAASSSERIAFNTLNRKTGNRVRREFVDSQTGDPVEREDQVKGFEIEDGRYVVLEPDEVAAAIPNSDKTLTVEAFIPCEEVDDVYFDKPYYLAPDKIGGDAYKLLRDGMKKARVAAIARTVLFRRLRTVLIRPHGNGLVGSTLNYDYEVRSSQKAFEEMPDLKIEGEMLELAKHIINTKKGQFDPKQFDDRYEAAVAELVKAKIEGRTLPQKKTPPASKPGDLLQALRESAGMSASAKTKRSAVNANAEKGRQKAARATSAKSRGTGGAQHRRAS
ncbi:non-homologous end joining protein Ku [Rhizobium ruizarguesonis]|uniref:non-homologous end joining protein Ku n=1 Tax=Rhizobium ruizarguesonis TaxID=2081791 RepID=UPI00103254B5|nr:Ku protein [Rhizobium ruizarguesonis]TAV01246.1 Ku protein [Rhizobium ruizarguesonis]TBA75069.1 Ku protein [Rhizobium ruizarguesonis]TBB64192.1 Ku protein [Rhizobium ruizarguesonis]TBC23868.1 Ku protein [Rhizobium ruizarguesonis]WSH61713.1 Ku protein [Rhizobium ruizarguesonis]